MNVPFEFRVSVPCCTPVTRIAVKLYPLGSVSLASKVSAVVKSSRASSVVLRRGLVARLSSWGVGGRFTPVEGQSRSRNVVIEFRDYDTALACYRSPEYQQNIKVRQPHAIAELIIIEGYDGPQP